MCYVDYQTHSVVLLGWQLESRKWEKFKFVINWENRVAWEYKEMVKKNNNTQTIELQICHVLSMTNALLICLATNNRFRIWRMAYP